MKDIKKVLMTGKPRQESAVSKYILRKKYWSRLAGRQKGRIQPTPVTIKDVTKTRSVFLRIAGTYKCKDAEEVTSASRPSLQERAKGKWVTPGWKEIVHHNGFSTYTTPYWIKLLYRECKEKQ